MAVSKNLAGSSRGIRRASFAGLATVAAATMAFMSATSNASAIVVRHDWIPGVDHIIAVQVPTKWTVASFRLSLVDGQETPTTSDYCWTGAQLAKSLRFNGDYIDTGVGATNGQVQKVQWFARDNCAGPTTNSVIFNPGHDTLKYVYLHHWGACSGDTNCAVPRTGTELLKP